ncbi:ThuA domain-containing protein [Agriterribacter sp.]|uniref:ThuA domain-containing protein n=1 Tax=Agriterribacter sp. TaxID=2821509 RepID=UPI002CBE443D|nr:ThuA domain-containing protein [Agriterribacter sp.]HRO44933.1 ThuA domain-containing protein [Agriterribacter sp.]HRQ15671.1 ThuA domain-containing protein [Agriterribacter sp.]
MKQFFSLSSCISRVFVVIIFCTSCTLAQQPKQWVTYAGGEGPGKGKHIVLISGDEEYRSEEALPMLGKILARKYGFKCTVLFAVDPATGYINVETLDNIPGLENLQTADLMVIFTRFRELPDEQMKYIDNYIRQGKPVMGLRTATHAFYYKKNPNNQYAKHSFNSKIKGWEDGFGRRILGETWINHHGKHGSEGTRGLINGILKDEKNPILNGVANIWGPTDVYTVRELPGDSKVLVYGQSTNGLSSDSSVNLNKSIMPVSWIRTYQGENGQTGRVFASTIGASIDFKSEDLRRLFVNAALWCTGMESKIPEKADVGVIGEYNPTMFGYDLFKKGVLPSAYGLK